MGAVYKARDTRLDRFVAINGGFYRVAVGGGSASWSARRIRRGGK